MAKALVREQLAQLWAIIVMSSVPKVILNTKIFILGLIWKSLRNKIKFGMNVATLPIFSYLFESQAGRSKEIKFHSDSVSSIRSCSENKQTNKQANN